MRIGLLHYAAPPVVGGVESVLSDHAILMADHGHEVRVIAGRGAQFDARVAFHHLPLLDSRHEAILACRTALDHGRCPVEFPSLREAIVEALRGATAQIDVLLAHNVVSLHKNLALTAALHEIFSRADAPRLVLWHHDLAWTASRYHDELHEGYPWNLLRGGWPGATHVAVSHARQEELARLWGLSLAQVRVVPNGLHPAKFLGIGPRATSLLGGLRLADADPLLLLPVRVTRRKNIELAVRVVAELRKQRPTATLLVTGPPGAHNPDNRAYLDELTALRSDLDLDGAVWLLAEKERPLADAEVADLYRLADALLLPSREEGFGIPMLEAGLARLPIFCARIPALRELAVGHAHSFSVAAEPSQIASLIADRLGADPLHAWRVRVRRRFSWTHIYEQHLAPLLREINPR